MDTLKLALDWTPNINHIGFFIARENGFYHDRGLEVEILDPASDNYAITPAKKVELGDADMALCPTESVISYRTKEKPFDMTAIAAIFQEDVSAIATRADIGITSPKDLDGKRYASYKAKYEDAIVQQMVKNDGGQGTIELGYPDKLGIWDALVKGSYDATWIFMNWEGVEVEAMDESFVYFRMSDYRIPYSYSPVIAASERAVLAQGEVYSRFLSASKQGFLHAKANPREAIDVFRPFVPAKDSKIDLLKALSASSVAFGDETSWGKMSEDVVRDFLDWIYAHDLERKSITINELMLNGLI